MLQVAARRPAERGDLAARLLRDELAQRVVAVVGADAQRVDPTQ